MEARGGQSVGRVPEELGALGSDNDMSEQNLSPRPTPGTNNSGKPDASPVDQIVTAQGVTAQGVDQGINAATVNALGSTGQGNAGDSGAVTQLGNHVKSSIRVGSPFATKSAVDYTLSSEELVRRESAMGGVVASAVLILFSGPSVFFFPMGAVLIALLGIGTALYGLLSKRMAFAAIVGCLHAFCLITVLFMSS